MNYELHKSLPDTIFRDPVLLFAAGILWERAFGGRPVSLPKVQSPPDNVAGLEASLRVPALESDGRVKEVSHSQASTVLAHRG